MFDKFRDLSFSTKIAVMFGAVIAAIALLIGVGIGVKALIGDKQSVTPSPTDNGTPSPSVSVTVTPQPIPSYDNSASNPYAPSSKQDEASLMRGYAVVEKFVMASCQINSGESYSSYVSGIKKYLSADSSLSIMDETTFNAIQSQSCEIFTGQPDAQIDDTKYRASVMLQRTTSLKGIKSKDIQSVGYSVTMEILNNKWYIYDSSMG
jgi:hypothetical protein